MPESIIKMSGSEYELEEVVTVQRKRLGFAGNKYRLGKRLCLAEVSMSLWEVRGGQRQSCLPDAKDRYSKEKYPSSRVLFFSTYVDYHLSTSSVFPSAGVSLISSTGAGSIVFSTITSGAASAETTAATSPI